MNPTDPNQGGMGGDQPNPTPVDPGMGQPTPAAPVSEPQVPNQGTETSQPVSEPQPEMGGDQGGPAGGVPPVV